MTSPAPAHPQESDSFQKLVGLMHAHGAKDDREAVEAARNLLGFAKLAVAVKRRREGGL
jgi:hypothetical protein